MIQPELSFHYRDGKGKEADWVVSKWKESGRYISGWTESGYRTFRKDRVICYRNSGETLLSDPFSVPPPKIERFKRAVGPEMLFTGFPAVQRASLEMRATEAGMVVVKSVTKNLTFLCGGPTAGPVKLEKARAAGVWILNQPMFFQLLETGELPEDEPEWL